MNITLPKRIVAVSLALACIALSGCDRRTADGAGTPSNPAGTATTPTPAPMPPASAASR
jgi:predicted small secreted protein